MARRTTRSWENFHKGKQSVILQAIRLGLHVGPVMGQKKARLTGLLRKVVVINGALCAVHVVENVYRQRQRRQVSSRTTLLLSSLQANSFQIFRLGAKGYKKRTLVIPSDDLHTVLFNNSGRTRRTLYIPLSGRPENPNFDFLRYEDAWKLLPAHNRRKRRPAG